MIAIYENDDYIQQQNLKLITSIIVHINIEIHIGYLARLSYLGVEDISRESFWTPLTYYNLKSTEEKD